MSPLIKVCGMTEAENIRNVELQGVDMIGFIFYPKSPRCLCQMPGYLPACAKRVGVFVNESKENILMYTDRFGLDYIQLHGNEAPEYCRSLRNAGLHLIKAFSILLPKDLLSVSAYNGLCDYYLFDTKTPTVRRFRQPVRLEPSAPLQRSHPVPAQRRHQPLQRKSPPGVPPSLFRRYRHQQPFRDGTGNKGCGTHLKLPERTQGRYDLTIYYLLFGCAIYATWQIVHCTW